MTGQCFQKHTGRRRFCVGIRRVVTPAMCGRLILFWARPFFLYDIKNG
jgi:hypothetical protein